MTAPARRPLDVALREMQIAADAINALNLTDDVAYTETHAIGEHSNLNCPWQNALDIASARMAHPPIAADHPESTCEDCGGLNVSWHVASELWNQVVRAVDDREPMLCPRCFAVRAFKQGIDPHWVLSVEQADRADDGDEIAALRAELDRLGSRGLTHPQESWITAGAMGRIIQRLKELGVSDPEQSSQPDAE